MPVDDAFEAWQILTANFIDDRGIIRRKDKNYQPTPLDYEAIDHLCNEWDYCWETLKGDKC